VQTCGNRSPINVEFSGELKLPVNKKLKKFFFDSIWTTWIRGV
jgi:hypothetical protein